MAQTIIHRQTDKQTLKCRMAKVSTTGQPGNQNLSNEKKNKIWKSEHFFKSWTFIKKYVRLPEKSAYKSNVNFQKSTKAHYSYEINVVFI